MATIKKDFIVHRTIIDIEGKPYVSTYSEEELIRCKDCKKHRKEDCKVEHHDFYPDGEVYSFIPDDDWFCADAKK